jgi:hypothetical protein
MRRRLCCCGSAARLELADESLVADPGMFCTGTNSGWRRSGQHDSSAGETKLDAALSGAPLAEVKVSGSGTNKSLDGLAVREYLPGGGQLRPANGLMLIRGPVWRRENLIQTYLGVVVERAEPWILF